MKIHALAALLLLPVTGCETISTHQEQLKETGWLVAEKLGAALVQTLATESIQSLTEGRQADYLDAAAAGLRTLPKTITSEDVAHVVRIWTTPPKSSTPPEMVAASRKAASVQNATGSTPEILAKGFNIAAAAIRENAKNP